jgi:carbon starvation protein
MKRQHHAWVTIVPGVWLLVCTLTAGLQKVFSPDPAIGFVSHAQKYGDALSAGKILAPAKTVAEMQRIILNDYVNTTMAVLFVVVVVAVTIYGLLGIRKALTNPAATAIEIGPAAAVAGGSHG